MDLTLDSRQGISVFHKAAFQNNNYVLTYLYMKGGFNIDLRDRNGNTPLHYACDQNAHFAIRWLLSFGADHNAQNF